MIRAAAVIVAVAAFHLGPLGTPTASAADVDEYIRKAMDLMKDGKLKPAENMATEAILADKGRSDAFLVRGMIRVKRENPEGAVEDINKAMKIGVLGNGEPLMAYFYRGRAQIMLKEYAEAEKDLTQALKFATKDMDKADVYAYRGLGRFKAGKPAAALTDLNEAIDLDPKAGVFYELRGDIHAKLGNSGKADRDYATAEKLKK